MDNTFKLIDDGFWHFMAVVGGNIITKEDYGVMLIYPVYQHQEESSPVRIRTFIEPAIAIHVSDMVLQHPSFNAGELIWRAIEAAKEMIDEGLNPLGA